MIRLIYLVANAAHVFVFGDSLIDIDGQRFFPTRADAVRAAASKGLTINRNGTVEATK